MDDRNSLHISPELLEQIRGVTAKRPKTVLEHILQYGYITTDDLKEKYGYDHPPRAVRDVRECGIELETFCMKKSNGRRMAAYRLTENQLIEKSKSGRRQFPKPFKQALLDRDGAQCALCGGIFSGNMLQIDHRVPYEVGGDKDKNLPLDPKDFMLVCGSCNRTKSWECEHCQNWKTHKSVDICSTCLFSSPQNYQHIAMNPRRRLTLTWEGEKVQDYDNLMKEALEAHLTLSEYVKRLLEARYFRSEEP